MVELSKDQRAEMQRLVSGVDVKAEKIRRLGEAGYQRSAIAEFLNIRYQQVRNVLVAAQEKNRGFQDSAGEPPRQEWAQVGPDGRVVIPVAYRRALGVEGGGHVLMLWEDGELRLVDRDAAIRRAQDLVSRYVPKGSRLSDELIAERRAEAARESANDQSRS